MGSLLVIVILYLTAFRRLVVVVRGEPSCIATLSRVYGINVRESADLGNFNTLPVPMNQCRRADGVLVPESSGTGSASLV